MSHSQNSIKRCDRVNCRRATFVETEAGLSADFWHGNGTHREVYTISEMIAFLAARGYVVMDAAKLANHASAAQAEGSEQK